MSKLEMIQEQILEAEKNKNWKRAKELSKEWAAEVKAENKRLNKHLCTLNEKIQNANKIIQKLHFPERRVLSPWKFF